MLPLHAATLFFAKYAIDGIIFAIRLLTCSAAYTPLLSRRLLSRCFTLLLRITPRRRRLLPRPQRVEYTEDKIRRHYFFFRFDATPLFAFIFIDYFVADISPYFSDWDELFMPRRLLRYATPSFSIAFTFSLRYHFLLHLLDTGWYTSRLITHTFIISLISIAICLAIPMPYAAAFQIYRYDTDTSITPPDYFRLLLASLDCCRFALFADDIFAMIDIHALSFHWLFRH